MPDPGKFEFAVEGVEKPINVESEGDKNRRALAEQKSDLMIRERLYRGRFRRLWLWLTSLAMPLLGAACSPDKAPIDSAPAAPETVAAAVETPAEIKLNKPELVRHLKDYLDIYEDGDQVVAVAGDEAWELNQATLIELGHQLMESERFVVTAKPEQIKEDFKQVLWEVVKEKGHKLNSSQFN